MTKRPVRIVAAIIKGGAGKTTTAVNLALALAKLDKEVLLIDMDPQGNASYMLNCLDANAPTIGHVLVGQSTLGQVIKETAWQGLCIAPAHDLMAPLSEMYAAHPPVAALLRDHLDQHLSNAWDGDYVIIDAPPSFGPGVIAALGAADLVLAPVRLGGMCLDGLASTFKIMKANDLQPDTRLLINALVRDGVGDRQRAGLAELEALKSRTLQTKIRQAEAIARAETTDAEGRVTPVIHAKSEDAQRVAEDYRALALEIMQIWPAAPKPAN